ncbi:MAG TPA: hypothetical protein VFT12_12255 [Thermoanaerobaculia bacterium]|nr:hypothetical protein [Thermoanaerobaculia bacterium]
MPKKALWFVAAGMAGLLYVLWSAGRMPARVTFMNQSGSAVTAAVMATDHGQVMVGTLHPGEARTFSIEATKRLEVTYRWDGEERRWRSINPVVAGQPLTLVITTAGRVAPRSRLGRTR